MAKPWARYETGWINHDKFRAISGNAIALWAEGKAYADTRFTDGILPLHAVKGFRFYARKSLTMLTTSIGLNPATKAAYAPLWEVLDGVGWQMHSYLDHNECGAAQIQRIFEAQVKRQQDRDRMARWREAKKARHDEPGAVDVTPAVTRDNVPSVTPVTPLSRSDQNTEPKIQNPEEERTGPPPPEARSNRPIFRGQRITVFEWQFDDIGKLLGPHLDAFDLHAWFYALDARCLAEGLILPRDGGRWLQAEVLAEAQRRGLPLRVAGGADFNAELAAIVAKGPSVRPS